MIGQPEPNRTDADDVNDGPGRGPIVIGVDGSDESRRGLNFASGLAIELGRPLLVVHALGLYDHISGWTTPIDDYEDEADDLVMNAWCASLQDLEGLEWSHRIVRGEAVHTLLSVADDVDAGLIVLGSHGAGRSVEPFLGSTSHEVLLKSHRPVLVVPPGADHPHRRHRVPSDLTVES